MGEGASKLVVRAVRTRQAGGVDVFAFFLPGTEVLRIADIARVGRNEEQRLEGFQRQEIRAHVNSIVEYLDRGSVLFPNSVILAMSPEIRFSRARGKDPKDLLEFSESGTLTIPVREMGRRGAWIVDGQQRALALSRSTNKDMIVPVVGFVSADLETQREQFILVNKAKPLPSRLITELLPETEVVLPRDLSEQKIPSELCNLLARTPGSPFQGLIRRPSDERDKERLITDTAIIAMIRNSMKSSSGALMPFKGGAGDAPDLPAMYRTVCMFWSAVRDTFPDAWARTPAESRLMHGAGIVAMGHLMDRIITRTSAEMNQDAAVRAALTRIAPNCRWTDGVWEGLGMRWDEIQNVGKHVQKLADHLGRLDFSGSRSAA